MAGYSPLYIKAYETGLVQNREEFLLPDDAYPKLINAFIFREKIRRKRGFELLGRLSRVYASVSIGNSSASPWTFNIYTKLSITPESTAQIELGSVVVSIGGIIFRDQGDGTLTSTTLGNSGTISYLTGNVTLTTTAAAGTGTTLSANYFPGLPVMGIRQAITNINNIQKTIAFDTVYAYEFVGTGWEEFIPGTTWTGDDTNFFWTTNYWVGDGNLRIFWATNFSGTTGDPIRYTNGVNWEDFAPQINAAGDLLNQALAFLPFRGRFVMFNTLEGGNLATSTQYFQRVRWSAIGTPFTTSDGVVVTTGLNPIAWRDDIRGQGGFLDIPTSEAIVSVGFVRDNLVIYCENSTWQLRYTGRQISPFQIEKVNSELGAEGTFSTVQFDTSLLGIGDKGIVECDSFKSDRIDIKIPDLVFNFSNENSAPERVHGIRDFQQRLAYWTYVDASDNLMGNKFPNRRLVYNYENDSWAIFTDSLTTLGTFQSQVARTWANSTFAWQKANFPWINRPAAFPSIVGGNQQGYVEYLDTLETNDVSLSIYGITGNTTTPTVINSPNHNLVDGEVIQISDIPSTDPFASLNGGKFGIIRIDADNFQIWTYDSATGEFSNPQLNVPGTYLGGGQISILDNFNIVSKKFNFLDDGQNIQMGYLDILMDSTAEGAITLNMYLNYNDNTPVNIYPQNAQSDTFFNNTVSTVNIGTNEASKCWHRVFCPVRAAFVVIEWTLSNAQLVGPEQASDVQIDAQILWIRKAGKTLLPFY